MFVALLAIDHPGGQTIRARCKAAHSARLNAGEPGLRVLQSGPLLDAGGCEIGSLGIFEAESCPQVEAFFGGDPYVAAGLFASITVREWLWRRGNPYV